jgi:rare lipoprotein A
MLSVRSLPKRAMERSVRPYVFVVVLTLCACAERQVQPAPAALPSPPTASVPDTPAGNGDVGKASMYSQSLAGKPTASGKPLDLGADVVASKTLPIGSTAKVTNLETGKSAFVKVEDRGRLPKGRLVDVTPATAKKLGLTKKEGVTPVSVQPATKSDVAAQP